MARDGMTAELQDAERCLQSVADQRIGSTPSEIDLRGCLLTLVEATEAARQALGVIQIAGCQ